MGDRASPEYLQIPVQVNDGKTAVVICAGRPLVVKVRISVVHLSDGRTRHEVTGARGILLHVEVYTF